MTYIHTYIHTSIHPYLRDDPNFGPELEQAKGGGVKAINDNGATSGLHDAENGKQKGALATASAADNSDLFPRLDRQGNALQHVGTCGNICVFFGELVNW